MRDDRQSSNLGILQRSADPSTQDSVGNREPVYEGALRFGQVGPERERREPARFAVNQRLMEFGCSIFS